MQTGSVCIFRRMLRNIFSYQVYAECMLSLNSVELFFRMFNSSLESFLSPVEGPNCHSNLSSNQSSLHRDMLIFIFNRIHTVCPNKRAQLLYDSIKTCSGGNRTEVGMGTNVTMVTDGTMGNSTTVATGNTTLQGNNRGQNETRMAGEDRKGTVTCDINFLSNDGVHEPKCSVSEAVEQFLMVAFDETATNCRYCAKSVHKVPKSHLILSFFKLILLRFSDFQLFFSMLYAFGSP